MSGASALKHLQYLAITNSKKIQFLYGIEKLESLKEIHLSRLPSLLSLTGIEASKTIESIELNTCRKISSFEPLLKLTALREVILNNLGRIESIISLSGCSNLQKLLIVDTVVEDGKIRFLHSLPRLNDVHFESHRGYDCHVEEFSTKDTSKENIDKDVIDYIRKENKTRL